MIKLVDILKQILEEDRCKRIADRKYDKPSAYKSGAIVRCRKGNIWKGLKESNENSDLKAISELFKINSELSSIGTPEQYAEYINTIFPDSKIKDIVYHSSPNKVEKFRDSMFGTYFSYSPIYGYGSTIHYVLLNIKNPLIKPKAEDSSKAKEIYDKENRNYNNPISFSPDGVGSYKYDASIESSTVTKEGVQIKVRTPEQIHVLGSKQDIEGFKKFNNTLNEYSTNVINQLVDKFKQEQPSLDTNIIQAYINRFTQLKNSPKVSEKDITKYSWKELETVIDSNQPKRIKAGKINDGEPSNDADLVYNQNGLRIYAGKTREACIKYGNGYSFCISARGKDTMYPHYRYSQGGTPYFVFDDTKTSEQDTNGNFIDPEHLLVVFIYKPEEGSEYGEGYSVTNANNPGEDEFSDFSEVEKYHPRLKGLENIFQPIAVDPKEKAEYEIKKKYNRELNSIERKYIEQDEDFLNNNYTFTNISDASKNINDLLSNKSQLYKFTATLKPTANKNEYDSIEVSQYRYGDPEKSYKNFVEEIVISMYDGPNDPKDSIKNWNITYKKQETSDKNYKSYLEEIKQIVDKYRNELSKLRLVREQLNLLNEKQKETLRTWFKRKGAPGKEGGWVDCNTCRDGKCKACGRKKGEKRAKYPSCRPTPAQCKSPGKGKKWGKTK